jgi:ELWxxDGT repeat protein
VSDAEFRHPLATPVVLPALGPGRLTGSLLRLERLEDRALPSAVLLRDIHDYTVDSAPDAITPVGGVAYFAANDGVHGRELWRTDGTEAGTYLVADRTALHGRGVRGGLGA